MRSIWPLLASLICAAPSACQASTASISEELYVTVGGIDQWITIKGQNRSNPIVLVVHGGPGAAFSPFDDSAFGKWRQQLTVVQWDQRGAGRTYGKSGPSVESTMTIDRMVQDGIEVSEYLVRHLHQEKIIVFGGSWGSMLAIQMVKTRPGLFCAYVGTAQMVNPQKGLMENYSRFIKTVTAANDQQAINELTALGPPPWNDIQNLFTFFRWLGAYEAKASTPLSMQVAAEYSSSEERTQWADAMNMSVKHFFGPQLDGPLMHVDLPAFGTDFEMPVFIVQGQEDLKTPPDFVKAYFDTITAPIKQFVLAPRTGHEPSATSTDMILSLLVQQARASLPSLRTSMNHAPPGCQCPFCRVAETLPTPATESGVVLVEPRVFAFIGLHHFAGIRGNCLIAPRVHYENLFDIPDDLGTDIFHATRLIAAAMKKAFGCEGISTRQHNGPAGDQDVWHYHLHFFPRFRGDGLWGGDKSPYTPDERLEVADRLRVALQRIRVPEEPLSENE